MIFNGINIPIGPKEVKKFAVPTLAKGDWIRLLHDDENPALPGSKQLKNGLYKVEDVRSALSSTGLIYVLLKKGSKIPFFIFTTYIDVAIDQKFILKIT